MSGVASSLITNSSSSSGTDSEKFLKGWLRDGLLHGGESILAESDFQRGMDVCGLDVCGMDV